MSDNINKRQPRGTANSRNLAVRITDRDLLLFQAFCKMRFLTTTQTARLFFNGSSWSANKRLRKLFNAGLIKVWIRSLSQDNIYSITRKGLSILIENEVSPDPVPKYPRGLDKNLNHLLYINQIRIALALGLPKVGGEISWWKSDWELRTPAKKHIIPDALFGIQWEESNEHIFTLELDNNTKSPKGFLRKVLGYTSSIHQSRGFYGISNFLILFVGRDPKWVERYRLSLSHNPVALRVWFATITAIEDGGVTSTIWKTAEREERYSLRELSFLPYCKDRTIGKTSLF